jgi:signal transduction histidine kinase
MEWCTSSSAHPARPCDWRSATTGRAAPDPARGSGLTGLRDRIEAAGGTLGVTSPAGGGTTLLIEIPV